jgi:hypothetical protein
MGAPGGELMGLTALADLLPDFAPRQRRFPAPETVPAVFQPDASPAGPDVDMLIAKAVAEAEAAVVAQLEGRYQEAVDTERERHAAELDLVRAEFGASAGADIAGRLAELEQRVTELATSAAARILGQIVSEDIRQRSVAQLAAVIRDAIDDADTVRIRVRGPQSLFLPLSQAMGSHARRLEYAEAPTFDLTVSIDETLFETRMAEWSDALSGMLR